MSVYQECKGSGGESKNTGAKEQCLEGLFIKPALAIPGFTFASATAAKDKANWDTAIAEKKIIPLYDVEELASANTEDTFFEGRTRQYRTASGKKVSTFSSFLGLCSHVALKSYHGKEMQLFEFTEDGAIKGVINDDGTIKGQDVVLNVGKRLDATADRPPSTLVTVNYKDHNQLEDNGAILRPDGWGATDIFGIFDVNIVQVSASATVIKVKVQEGCAGGGENLTSLEDGDLVVKNLAGAVQTVSFVSADADGIYTLTGTGFASNFTVGLNGVVTQTGISYESPEPLKITVT
jgi:hypothetical protein